MKQGQTILEDKTPLVSDNKAGKYQRHTSRQGQGLVKFKVGKHHSTQ